MRKILNLILILLIGFIIQSCDPTYNISISNQTDSEITIQAKKTIKFRSDNIKTQSLSEKNDENWIEFKVEANNIIDCGMAIAGLKNDLPFSELLIITESDTLKAENEDQVMELFEKTGFGNLKTPYLLIVE